jgi:hypothetical protein
VARLTSAQTATVVRSITLAEYGTEMGIAHYANDSGAITITTANPASAEREVIRDWVRVHAAATDSLVDDELLAMLDERDHANEWTYGEKKGEQCPLVLTLWIVEEDWPLLSAVSTNDEPPYSVLTTINETRERAADRR